MIDEEQPKKSGGGRKPSFILTNDKLAEIEALAYRGLSQKMIAAYFGIGLTTWNQKRKKYPEIRERFLKGKAKGVSFTSGKLMDAVKRDNFNAIKYYLDTVGKFSPNPDPDDDDDDVKPQYKPIVLTTTDPIEAAKFYQQIMQGTKKG